MPEFCPKTGRPCPVDKNFDALETAYSEEPERLAAVLAIKKLVNLKRAATGCDGVVIENDSRSNQPIAEHCGSDNREIERMASITGEAFGFDPILYTGVTMSEIR